MQQVYTYLVCGMIHGCIIHIIQYIYMACTCMYLSCLLHVCQEKQRLDGMLQNRDREIKSLHSYEHQLSSMSHALSKLEAALRQEQEEKV